MHSSVDVLALVLNQFPEAMMISQQKVALVLVCIIELYYNYS